MRVLFIIGIIMSVIGLITCIFVMTEAKCYCNCDDGYFYNNSVPDDVIGGSMLNMLLFIFFLVMSIVGVSKSYSNKPHLAQHIPPFQANPYPNYQQPYAQPYQQPYQQNPYQNPYQQNPYQHPQQNPFQNPTPPQQNPYQNPNTPENNPFQNPEQKNPFEKPDQNDIPPATPPTNPWEPK